MSPKPNILLVVMDSVRAANCSTYGYNRPTTPRLDALAVQGTLYEQAISVGCWTLPVHATMFTGLFPLNHGLTISTDALPDDHPTLARRLSDLGYATACFSNNPYISDATGLTQGFQTVEELWRTTRPRGTSKPKGTKLDERLERMGMVGRAARRPARTALRFRRQINRWREWTTSTDSGASSTNAAIRRWLHSEERGQKPFFAFVNFMESHERYRPPYPYNRRFLPSGVSRWRAASPGTKPEILAAPKSRRDEELRIIQGLYDGALAYLDQRVGELIVALETAGAADDTLVVVTSDHGDSLGEHDHLGHRISLYEPLVHVPLVVRLPGRFPAGFRSTEQVQLGDLFPTVLELAGDTSIDASTGGFTSLLAATSVRRATVAENTAPKALGSVGQRMLRGVRYKLIRTSSGLAELYDLVADPGETRNLANERPGVVTSLSDELDAWQRSLAGKTIETREADFDEETLRRLQGLGYIG